MTAEKERQKRSLQESASGSSLLTTDFDWSMMNLFRMCERRFFYSNVMGIARPPGKTTPGAMEYGWAIDQALDIAYQFWALTPDQRRRQHTECYPGSRYDQERYLVIPMLAAKKTFKDIWGDVKSRGYTPIMGRTLLDEYANFYWPPAFDIIDTDVKGFLPITDDCNLRFKVDLLYFRKGYFYIMETKTVGTLAGEKGKMWWAGKNREYQTDGYHMGAEAYFDQQVRAVTLNAICTKAAKGAGATEVFQRRDLLKPTKRRAQYLDWLHETISDIRDRQERTFWPFNPTDGTAFDVVWKLLKEGSAPYECWPQSPTACTMYNRLCEYDPLCEHDMHAGSLSKYVRTRWQPYMGHEERKYEPIA